MLKGNSILRILLGIAGLMVAISLWHLAGNSEYAKQLELPPCYFLGGPFHHYFKPSCQGISPLTGIHYEINEAGLRERPRKVLGTGGVLLLGDSIVEGKGLDFPNTLGQRLEAALPFTFVNAGVRSRGPIIESEQLPILLPIFKPRLVLWVLNENDVDDDKLAYALQTEADANGVPTKLSTEDFDSVAWLAQWKARLGALGNILNPVLYRAYYSKVQSLMQTPTKFEVCAGTNRGLRILRDHHIPVIFVLTPLGPFNRNPEFVEHFRSIIPCLEGQQVLDVRDEMAANADDFLPLDTHFNPKGVEYLKGRLLEPLLKALASHDGAVFDQHRQGRPQAHF